jgi:hypothetical protein
MKKRKPIRRKSVKRRSRSLTGISGARSRRRRTTKRGLMSGAAGDALGLILGGVVTGLVDKPLSGIGPLSDAKIRAAVKAGLGYFLMNRPGIVGGIGKGMLAVSGMQLAQSLMPGALGEDIPSLISESIDVPSLISEAMDEDSDDMSGYTSDEINGYTSDEIGYTSDELGEDEDEDLGDEFGDEFGADVMGV